MSRQVSKPRAKKKLEAYLGKIDQILKEDKALPRKQAHTAKRIRERQKGEGFPGGYTIVKDTVREITAYGQEVFVPLVHRPGEVGNLELRTARSALRL